MAEAGARVVNVLESFWASGFAETWQRLEPEMHGRAQQMRLQVTRKSFGDYSRGNKLPLTMEGNVLMTVRGAVRTPVTSPASIYLLPSAFNFTRLWAAYSDSRGRTRYFLPVCDPGLAGLAASSVNPALVFRALGDTTRYAIASSIARNPMTSVELARAFGVSKPTISHHVQLMRAAGLLEERPSRDGVLLTLNRQVLERASGAAAREMFSGDETSPVVRRTRRPNSQR